MTIYEKMMSIMADVQYLAKDDRVEFGNTKYKALMVVLLVHASAARVAPWVCVRHVLAPYFFATLGAFPQVIYRASICIAVILYSDPSPVLHLRNVGGGEVLKIRNYGGTRFIRKQPQQVDGVLPLDVLSHPAPSIVRPLRGSGKRFCRNLQVSNNRSKSDM